MNWTHAAVLIVALLVGFWLCKKYPNVLNNIPVLGPMMG